MATRHSKREQRSPHNPNENSCEEKSTNRHVYIEPGSKIDLVDELKGQYKTQHDEQNRHQGKQLLWTKIAAGLLLLTAGLTFWQGYSTKRAADSAAIASKTAAGQLIETSREFREGRRAWMGAVIFVVTQYPSPFQVQLKFVNSGNTPATNIQNALALSIVQAPLPPGPTTEYPAAYVFHKGGAVAPHGEFNVVFDDRQGDVSLGQTILSRGVALQRQSQFLLIHGEMKYDDVDGKPHVTTYCFYMDNPTTHRLVYCQGHNDMN